MFLKTERSQAYKGLYTEKEERHQTVNPDELVEAIQVIFLFSTFNYFSIKWTHGSFLK